MKSVKRNETMGNIRQFLTRSKRREQEAADEKDFISSLPLDLILQILSKLPPKSIAKLISVSKLWSSLVRGKDLTKFFISRSSTRPSFLFVVEKEEYVEFHLFSQEEPSSCYLKTIITKAPKLCFLPPVNGLICGEQYLQYKDTDGSQVICNPSTGQFVTLPRVKAKRRGLLDDISHYLGYDPVNHQYKILRMVSGQVVSEEHQVFTLGAKKRVWRRIECKHPHLRATKGLCRDGVVYYGARCNSHVEGSLIVMSFDLRSEDFGVIKLPEDVKIQRYQTLVNYHEKIAFVDMSYTGNVDMWVLEDVKKQKWSKISFLLPDTNWSFSKDLVCEGTISTGEIIFAPSFSANPFFLVYYDLEGNNVRRVDFEGVRGGGGLIRVFMDHVESPMFLQRRSLIRSSLLCWK